MQNSSAVYHLITLSIDDVDIDRFIDRLTRRGHCLPTMSRIKLAQALWTFIVLTHGVTGLQHTDDMQTLLISQSHCPVFCGTCTSTTLSFLTVFRPGSVSSGSPLRRSSRFLPVSCYIAVSIHVSNAVHAHSEAPLM